MKAELAVSSTARDTDFIVRVSDVYPDGRSILIIDTVRRARYRESFDYEALLKPDKIYKLNLFLNVMTPLVMVMGFADSM
ncbi:CocE/NonD family hydrolase C-terminal non-catalytic domain-containing protein, partial [Pseudomonas aeruginosa]|uniref:CocE/NonD family hydrolase C-terminal non-catalytic domain-containing protein n=1 Tax=Pseudomonas aeruginosa TaxID=287 RepID=UPI003CFB764B